MHPLWLRGNYMPQFPDKDRLVRRWRLLGAQGLGAGYCAHLRTAAATVRLPPS